MNRETLRVAAGVGVLLLIWEAVGRLTPLGHSVTASPSLIVELFWRDGDLYRLHIWATVRSATLGFLIGNAVAILAAIVFCRFPAVEGVFAGVNIAMFAMPPIVVGPVLVLIFSGDLPQIVLAALVVYFPTMAATLVGLREIDPRLVDLAHAYGGGPDRVMRFIRLRSALPSLLAGLRQPRRWRCWGRFSVNSAPASAGASAASCWALLERAIPPDCSASASARRRSPWRVTRCSRRSDARSAARPSPSLLAASRLPDQIADARQYDAAQRALLVAAAVVTPFLLWWLILRVSGLSEIIAPTPYDVFAYLFLKPGSAEARGQLAQALAQTLPVAALGLVCGLAAAFLLAALSVVRPTLVKTMLPFALLLQTTPLVALTPIVLLLFGRDTLASVVMAVLVVFLPAYVLLAQGFALTPRAARELVQAYGGGKTKELLMVSIPYAAPYLFAAAKLVAPRALLGVMVAEWLLSGVGLGNLLNASRGMLDYDMVWAGAVVSILISIAAYQGVSALERLVRA